jgi:hypothetical protein
MKYLKLFESWLNEQDEAATKQFSPEKSFESPVLDILQKDFFSIKNPEQVTKVLKSVIGRGVEKKSVDTKESTAVTVKPLTVEELQQGKKKVLLKGTAPGSNLETLKLADDAEFMKALDEIALDAKGIGDSAAKGYFIHTSDTPENKLYWSTEDTKYGISTQAASIVFFPNEGFTKVNPEAPMVELPVVIVSGGKSKVGTFGQVLAMASSKFADASMLDKTDAGSVENLKTIFPTEEKKA